MELITWLLYISVISALIFFPGPSALLCISDGLKFGKKRTVPTILGGAMASLTLMTLSAIGLGAILIASEAVFFIIKLLGALYLIYLGWVAWKESNIIITNHNEIERKSTTYSYHSLFAKGFTVGISNPKDLLFFIALFPSFMNIELPQVKQYIVLACTWLFIDFISMFMYAGLGSKVRPWLSKTRNMKLFNRAIGSIFIALGSFLLISTDFNRKA